MIRAGTVHYSYDPLGQLTGATYSASSIPNESYAWDSNGNPTGSGYVIGDDNRLLSDGTYRYSYDAEGNRTAKFIDEDDSHTLTTGDTEVTEYGWDNRNRLAKVTTYATKGQSATKIVDEIYDLENRWIGENVDSDADAEVDHQRRFAYDGNQIVLQFDGDCPDFAQQNGTVPFTFDGNGNPLLTVANLSHRYLWGPAVDQLLADEQVSSPSTPGNVVWPLGDQLGTIRDLATTDTQTGETTVAVHRVFDSFGAETNPTGDCLFGFTGRPTSQAIGEQNNGNRWYDAAIGRWMSQDPAGFAAGDTNLSRYCFNNPTMLADPSGLDYIIGIWGGRLYKQIEDANGNPINIIEASPEEYEAYYATHARPGGAPSWVWPWDPAASWDPIDTLDQWTGATRGDGYIDINLGVVSPWWIGVTGGFMINVKDRSIHPYLGGAVGYPGVSVTVTESTTSPTPGWGVGFQATDIISGQLGYSFGEGGGPYWEVGGGYGAGVTGSLYYVWGPF